MADIAASVLARLKNKAKESGRSYQLCLQLFCQEEFLRRLEKSKYAENLVLKGGLFIYSVTGFDSRVTVDVDFLLRKVPSTPEQLQTVIETIVSTPSDNDFVTFEIRDIAPIAIAKKYAGIGVSLVARIKNTKTVDYSTVLKTIKEFLTEPFMFAISHDKFTKFWFANDNNWTYGANKQGGIAF